MRNADAGSAIVQIQNLSPQTKNKNPQNQRYTYFCLIISTHRPLTLTIIIKYYLEGRSNKDNLYLSFHQTILKVIKSKESII